MFFLSDVKIFNLIFPLTDTTISDLISIHDDEWVNLRTQNETNHCNLIAIYTVLVFGHFFIIERKDRSMIESSNHSHWSRAELNRSVSLPSFIEQEF